MRCMIYSLHRLRTISCCLEALRTTIYLHRRGAFSVARFDRQGNAKAYESWNEQQNWLHVFFVYGINRIKKKSFWGRMAQKVTFMRTIKLLSVFVLAMSSFIAHAQDVIVKNDGSTITSKVTEITNSEIKYKKFSNLNGPIYTIGKNEVNYINYENGERETITPSLTLDSTFKNATPTQDHFRTSDSELLKASIVQPALRNAEKFRKRAFIGGGFLLAASISFFCAGESIDGRYLFGGILAGASLVWGGSFLLAAKNQSKKAQYYSETAVPIMQLEITDSKKSSLYANIDLLNDGFGRNKTLGLGLHLNF